MPNERCRSLQSVGRFTDAIRDIQIERLEGGAYRAFVSGIQKEELPSPETNWPGVLRRAFAEHPELQSYGNQKLSRVLKEKLNIVVSERQIVDCREQNPELRREVEN